METFADRCLYKYDQIVYFNNKIIIKVKHFNVECNNYEKFFQLHIIILIYATLKEAVTKQDITNLRNFLKRPPPIGKESSKLEKCLEPICALLEVKPERVHLADGIQRQSCHKPLFKYLSQSTHGVSNVITNFDRETLDEKTFSTVFQLLENEHIQKASQINSSLGAILNWAQALLSYHVMVHPYRIRNKDSILGNLQQGKIVASFAETVDDFMNQFYTFKAFLMRVGFLQRDSHFAFNLSNISTNYLEKREGKMGSLPKEALFSILQYIDNRELISIRGVCRNLANCIRDQWMLRAAELQSQVTLTIEASSLRDIPFLGYHNSDQIYVLEHYLTSEGSILSRVDVEELKSISKPAALFQQIYQAFCILLQIKPIRKPQPDGSINNDYFKAFQCYLLTKPNLKTYLSRDFNPFMVPQEILFTVNQYLTVLLTRQNRLDYIQEAVPSCVFKLLLWTLSTLTYCKLANPLNFLTKDFFLGKFTSSQEEIEIVQQLISLIEQWRFCKGVMQRQRSQDSKERMRSYKKQASTLLSDNTFESLLDLLKSHLSLEVDIMRTDDPYGTHIIGSLSHFNPQIIPTLSGIYGTHKQRQDTQINNSLINCSLGVI